MATVSIEKIINESVIRDRIVTVDYDAELADELQAACDNSVKNGPVIEYWGVDDEGNDWRIHLRVER